MPSDRNWAHDVGFDADTMSEFERRLARAKPASRPGYLRVKGATLLEWGDPAAVAVAIELLRRVVDDYDHFLEVPCCHELLGQAYRRLGDLPAAEAHLRACLETADERRNGTTKMTELTLAEVLLEQGRTHEAGDLLASGDLRRSRQWKSDFFRYAVACARYEDRTGGTPKPWAEEALELAADRTPQLPRHPTVGLVEADDAVLREMRRLSSPR